MEEHSMDTRVDFLQSVGLQVTQVYNFKGIGINQEKEIYLPNKEYISSHRWEGINMVVKYTVHMNITAELKANWLLVVYIATMCFFETSKEEFMF